jgi:ABC-type multidrug transport system ATPase subunit
MMSTPPVLAISEARYVAGSQLLFDDLDLSLPAGACAAVVGPNGAGKSTLLRCVVGDHRLDGGSITVMGYHPRDTSRRFRAAVSADLGENATFLDVSVTEHLKLLARTHRMGDVDIDQTLINAGLADVGDRYPHALSTGQRQRFALAAAFLRPANLVVLDEPERGLDTAGQHWVRDQLRLIGTAGTAVIVATHSDLIAASADMIVELGR